MSLLTVTYTGEPDVIYEFATDGERLLFGRDADQCQIVIWSAINGNDLSRVAGAIWRMEDELWVRNLSTRHDLYVESASRPAEPPLPPRRDDGVDRGPARAVPDQLSFLRAPGGCELLVRQVHSPRDATLPDGDEAQTVRLPPVPAQLRPVARALCAPLFGGSQLPATYAQIAADTGTNSLKRTRILVGQLCALYAQHAPTLAARVDQRLRHEAAQLGLAASARSLGGIWVFDVEDESDDGAESAEQARRRALSLPDYYEVAHLLVRHRLVLAPGDEPLATGAAGV